MSSDSQPAGQWVRFLPSRQHKIVTVWWILVPNGDLWKIRGRCKVSGGQVEGKHCCTTKHRDAKRILHPHVCTHTHTYITHTSDGEISTSSSSLPFWTRAAVLVFIFSVTFFHCVLENDSAFSLSAAVVGDSVCVVWRGQRSWRRRSLLQTEHHRCSERLIGHTLMWGALLLKSVRRPACNMVSGRYWADWPQEVPHNSERERRQWHETQKGRDRDPRPDAKGQRSISMQGWM